MIAAGGNPVAAVTGASGGLGREIALALAARGYDLALFARREERLRETALAAAARTPGGNAPLVVVGDATRRADCERLAMAIEERFGRLDCLVNNAGASIWARFDELDLEVARRLFEVDFWGAVYCARAALPMLSRARGIICNISSVQGRVAPPYHCAYAAAKHALEAFFESARYEHPEIAVLTARPAWLSGTDLSQNRYAAPKFRGGHGGIAATAAAEKIAAAIVKRKERVTIPAHYGLLPLLFEVAPRLARKIVVQKIRARMRRGGASGDDISA